MRWNAVVHEIMHVDIPQWSCNLNSRVGLMMKFVIFPVPSFRAVPDSVVSCNVDPMSGVGDVLPVTWGECWAGLVAVETTEKQTESCDCCCDPSTEGRRVDGSMCS